MEREGPKTQSDDMGLARGGIWRTEPTNWSYPYHKHKKQLLWKPHFAEVDKAAYIRKETVRTDAK
jgi:hypothetical protein